MSLITVGESHTGPSALGLSQTLFDEAFFEDAPPPPPTGFTGWGIAM